MTTMGNNISKTPRTDEAVGAGRISVLVVVSREIELENEALRTALKAMQGKVEELEKVLAMEQKVVLPLGDIERGLWEGRKIK